MSNAFFKKGLILGVIILFFVTNYVPNITGNSLKDINILDIKDLKFVPGEIIVKFSKDYEMHSSEIEKLNEKYHVNYINKIFKNHENTILDNIYVLSVPKTINVLSIVEEYSKKTFIEYSEPNYLLNFFVIPNDRDFSNQWYMHNFGQMGGTPDADIDAPEAWDNETGSSDITIAIIDSGVDYTHPDLADNIWINIDEIPDNQIDDDENGYIDDNIGYDFVGDSIIILNPDNDPIDEHGHGTHCAGLASAVTNNYEGMAGVCWNSKIMCIRVGAESGFINLLAVIDGIVYATDNGADIISMSFGSFKNLRILKDAIDYSYENGVIPVAGAGNFHTNIKFYPAAYENVLSVSATNYFDEKADFSAYGGWIDVCAPGENIYSTLPSYIVRLNKLGYKKYYDYLDGTSMACPIVAGLAGLILSYNHSFNQNDVKGIIKYSCDWIDSNYPIGNGRINARKALLIASDQTDPPYKPNSPIGQINGEVEKEYTYSVSTIDPDGDELYYLFSWGDGAYSDWVGPYASGTKGNASHKWTDRGTYKIKAKARDSNGIQSEWSNPITITIPRNKAIESSSFINFLSNHPSLFLIFQQLIKPNFLLISFFT